MSKRMICDACDAIIDELSVDGVTYAAKPGVIEADDLLVHCDTCAGGGTIRVRDQHFCGTNCLVSVLKASA